MASNRIVDVTEARFDAGIRYGGTVPEDMVAQRLSADVRWVVAASRNILPALASPGILTIFNSTAASAIV